MYVCQRPEVNLQYFFLLLSTLFLFIYSFLNLRNNFISGRLYIPQLLGGGSREEKMKLLCRLSQEWRLDLKKAVKQSYTLG